MSASHVLVLAAGLAVAVAASAQPAQEQERVSVMGRPAPEELGVKKKAERLLSEGSTQLPSRDVRLAAQSPDEVGAAMRQLERGPRKIGFNRAVGDRGLGIDLRSEITWHLVEGGGQVGVLKVTSPGAMALRMALEIGDLPEGAELRFFGERPSDLQLIMGEQILSLIDRNIAAGDVGSEAVTYWSPVIEGAWIGLEIYLRPDSNPGDLVGAVTSVSHLTYSPRTGQSAYAVPEIGEAATCNLDVTCYSSWSESSATVAKMVFTTSTGSKLCTGTLVNDDVPDTYTPYFLSANHCISSQSVASTLNTYWFYRSSSCNSSSLNPAYAIRSGGAALLYASSNTDTAFMRLNESPPGGAWYSGWSSDVPTLSTQVTGIHHPRGDLQKITFGTVDSFHSCTWEADGNFYCTPSTSSSANVIKVAYSNGITEPGSSGSGVIRDAAYLIGTLWGSNSVCSGNANHGFYGRFDKAYQQGNLAQWLKPTSFSLSVSTAGSGSGTVTSSPAGINCGSACSANFAPSSAVTLTAVPAIGSVFAGWSGACTGSASTCMVSMNSSKTVTATFNVAVGIANGQVVSNLSGAAGSSRYLYIDIPSGATNLVLTTSGGSGDQDLYLRFNGLPTLSAYDCRIFTVGNNGSCTINTPSAGRYQILIYGYTSYSGVSLQATYSSNATYLENPFPGAKVSGIGLVSGWTCSSGVVEVSFNNGPRDNLVPKGSGRGDLLAICGRTDVGFGLLFNYNLLGPGNHTIQLFVNGQQVGSSVPFTVTVPAGEFIRGASKTVEVPDFPAPGKTTVLQWQESTQNFAITGVR